jgi:predicted dehydrogenase
MKKLTRRAVLKASSAIVAGYWLGSAPRARAASANDKLNLACIGIGGQGAKNVSCLSGENLVALCDVDKVRGAKMFARYPKAKHFTDYRKMLDSLDNQIDGVVVSTPDHTHFHPARQAILMGKACYCEKPLAHTVWECRELTRLAKKMNVATQLGNQRHAFEGMRRAVEAVQSGMIGKVNEVTCVIGGDRGMPPMPTKFPPVPATLDWDLWLGPVVDADKYKYTPEICPYSWRFWWDFGTGETGNWGCHIFDIPYWALGLKYPTRIDATGPAVDALRTPKSMDVTYKFSADPTRPSVAQGPITLNWSHCKTGTIELKNKYGFDSKGRFNTFFIGEKGQIAAGFNSHEIKMADGSKPIDVPTTIPKSPGFHQEWITAAKGGPRSTCDFVDYSSPLAESILLGNIAYRAGGFDWDGAALKVIGNEKANALIKPKYRPGWPS